MPARRNLWVLVVFGGATAVAAAYLLGSLFWLAVIGEPSLTFALPGAVVTGIYVWCVLVRWRK